MTTRGGPGLMLPGMSPGVLRSASPPPPPRLAPLALRLLAPTVLLASVASVALVRDWHAARLEAVSRATELATLATDRLVAVLRPARAPATGGGAIARAAAEDSDSFTVGGSNELLAPRFVPWPPEPAPLPVLLDPAPRTEWAAARSAFVGGDWPTAIAAYDRFLSILSATPENRDAAAGAEAALLRHRLNARFERALALEHAGLTNDLAEAFAEVAVDPSAAAPDGTSEAGVPVGQLAALRALDLVGNPETNLPVTWQRGPDPLARLLDGPGSPFLGEFLARLTQVLVRSPAVSDSTGLVPATLEARHQLAERSRAHYETARRHRSVAAVWPNMFWLDDSSPGWLAVAQPTRDTREGAAEAGGASGRRFVVFPEDRLFQVLRDVLQEREGGHADFGLRVEAAGRTLGVGRAHDGPWPEDLATVNRTAAGGTPLVLGVGLLDPARFYAGQRRRVLVFGGLLLAATAAALVAVRTTHRSLVHQHELAVQKSNFVSSVSHELRAPLGSIRLLAEGLERGTITGEDQRREYFRLIGQETRRLGALVDNVLDFSRIDQGRQRYEFEPVDLAALVRGTARLFEPLAVSRGLTLEVHVPETPGTMELLADGRALQQALLNLLDNALKHSPSGAPIRVALAARAGRLELSVADAGPGIPAADHQRIFEPFFRRGSELRRETPGIGIGLSIVRHVALAHQARVEVASVPGAGATFTLVLPCAC